MKFAKAIYCPGVDSWYLRFGPEHGIDVMIKQVSENQAKIHEKLINASLNRELTKRAKRRKSTREELGGL